MKKYINKVEQLITKHSPLNKRFGTSQLVAYEEMVESSLPFHAHSMIKHLVTNNYFLYFAKWCSFIEKLFSPIGVAYSIF
jgi:hypothetical protein